MTARRTVSRAFTLLELLVVLALLSLAATLTLPAIARMADAGDPRDALRDLRAALSVARADALRSGRPVDASIAPAQDGTGDRGLELTGPVERRWPSVRMTTVEDDGARGVTLAVRFASNGRADRLAWRFAGTGEGADNMWKIPFDPVSGAVQPHQDAQGDSEGDTP